MRTMLMLIVLTTVLSGCTTSVAPPPSGSDPLDAVADDYVRLVLAVGRHDENVVDAYYGPPEWREEAGRGEPVPAPELLERTRALLARAGAAPASERRVALEKQLVAIEGFLRRLLGEPMTLAEEARALFDIEVPACPLERLEAARARLDAVLPGDGELADRLRVARAAVEVPAERLPAVVDASLAELRRRTAALVELPAGEHFRVEMVRGTPWGAYNWYQGEAQSLIQINVDLPSALPQVLATMAHEGYPGHHVYNVLLESRLVRGRGWREFTVYPLYSPQSLIAEGTANVGLDVVMSRAEQAAFLRDVLAPLAGVDAGALSRYREVSEAMEALDCAGGEAARKLLDEGRPDEEVIAFLVRYGSQPDRARRSLAFARAYRSYIFTYTVGEDLIDAWLGDGEDRAARFFGLLQRPVVPSALAR